MSIVADMTGCFLQRDSDAAKAYKEFEDFFAGDDAASAPRGGVRGHQGGSTRGGVGGGFVKAGGGESFVRSSLSMTDNQATGIDSECIC